MPNGFWILISLLVFEIELILIKGSAWRKQVIKIIKLRNKLTQSVSTQLLRILALGPNPAFLPSAIFHLYFAYLRESRSFRLPVCFFYLCNNHYQLYPAVYQLFESKKYGRKTVLSQSCKKRKRINSSKSFFGTWRCGPSSKRWWNILRRHTNTRRSLCQRGQPHRWEYSYRKIPKSGFTFNEIREDMGLWRLKGAVKQSEQQTSGHQYRLYHS